MLPLITVHLIMPHAALRSLLLLDRDVPFLGSQKMMSARSKRVALDFSIASPQISVIKFENFSSNTGLDCDQFEMFATRILRAPARQTIRTGLRCFSSLPPRADTKAWTPIPYITETIVSLPHPRRCCMYANYSGWWLAAMCVLVGA